MKSGYTGILIITIVLAGALAVSGCSGGSGTATPTPAPGGYTMGTPTPTPASSPTQPPSGSTGTLGALYQTRGLSWFAYQFSASMEGTTITSTMKWEMLGQEMHNGNMSNHMRLSTSVNFGGVAPQVVDVWSTPGSSSGQANDYTTSDARLTQVGTETITVPAGTFACTKYEVTMADGSTSTFWASPQVPVPVQYAMIAQGETQTVQLTGWG